MFDENAESESFIPQERHPTQVTKSAKFWSYFPWGTTILFASLSLFQAVLLPRLSDRSGHGGLGAYETGWSTDFESAKTEIAVNQITFTGSPVFDDNGTYWIPNPGPIKYIGEPSPELDKNWEDATWGRYFLVTEDEARQAFSEHYGGDDVSWLWNDHAGGYVVGIDMFHTLHCLNRLRKAFHPQYYPEDDDPRHRVHRDHCFEQIRQFIMCSGDMTLIPTRYSPFLGHNYVESDVKHTCRAFEPLRDWVRERYNGSSAIQPDCPHGTYEDLGTRLCRTAEHNGHHGI